ncbi:MAG: hypothetical protein CBB87_08705 [Micavibrio sp. TMED27]|nr:hypothetical protein [Micavibrio sp.]OUT90744.1 MAG: hypothetical protein CBB87_08705 [Micavibrio sp. TMED27]|tara:strand:- start:118 stop:324 length:207 start_codon:yes stop_codon:yes gene_type:complete
MKKIFTLSVATFALAVFAAGAHAGSNNPEGVSSYKVQKSMSMDKIEPSAGAESTMKQAHENNSNYNQQ